LLSTPVGSEESMMFVLLRHAHALDKRSWDRPDAERPLSRRGEAQAVALVGHLSSLPVRRVLSSPALRCRQTVEHLARELGLPVEVSDLLAADADVVRLGRFADDPGGDALLCTHGETLAALLARWQSTHRLRLPVPVQSRGKSVTEKSGGWIMEEETGVLTARYLPPPGSERESLRSLPDS
jgi:broad specificity phosphatase PhoE